MHTLLAATVLALAAPLHQGATPPAPSADLGPQELSFPSLDDLELTADLYRCGVEDAPLIVLFHQAGWSRGEYREIAPRLVALGYDCLAVDQRSGGEVGGVPNETARRATEAGKGTTFVDAEQDVVAALEYAREELKATRVLAWGSSYSAALVLRTVALRPELASACAAFAPGEYFTRFGKPADWIESSLGTLACPVFVTSSGSEEGSWKAMYAAIPDGHKRSFLPSTAGQHGSRALWKRFDDSPAYWSEVERFLKEALPAHEGTRAGDAKGEKPASRPLR